MVGDLNKIVVFLVTKAPKLQSDTTSTPINYSKGMPEQRLFFLPSVNLSTWISLDATGASVFIARHFFMTFVPDFMKRANSYGADCIPTNGLNKVTDGKDM